MTPQMPHIAGEIATDVPAPQQSNICGGFGLIESVFAAPDRAVPNYSGLEKTGLKIGLAQAMLLHLTSSKFFRVVTFSFYGFSIRVRMSKQSDSELLLESNHYEALIFFLGAGVGITNGYAIAALGHPIGWVIGAVPGMFFVYLIIRRLLQRSTLELNNVGFTYKSKEEMCVLRWSDVGQFRVTGKPFFRTLEFSVTDSARKRVTAQNNDQAASFGPKEEIFLTEDYGLGMKNLCLLLNEWRSRNATRSKGMKAIAHAAR